MAASEQPAWAHVPPEAEEMIRLTVSESYSSVDIHTGLFVMRGREPGPTLLITAAVHGDEINGTGTIRRILIEKRLKLVSGTLVMVPVVNVLGFERHARYMPDRRDLNRCFPGSESGSLTSRLAASFFDQVVRHCDYCIDLHTAAIRRTNFPNVRADTTDPRVAEFARAFGASLLVAGKGPEGSLRRSACAAGCATLILEAGEVWKVEPTVVEYGIQGIRNCLNYLGMIDAPRIEPPYRIDVDKTKWVRARHGGFLEFHVAPGDIVAEGDWIATNHSLSGDEQFAIKAERAGVVLGMTTLPSVAPGDPVCHLAFSQAGSLRKVERAIDKLADDSLHERIRADLARNVLVTEPRGDEDE